MLDYVSIQQTLHTRGVKIDEKQYFFVLSCVLGESPEVAYAMIYDTKEFKHAIETEDFEAYITKMKDAAETQLMQQEEKQLADMLKADYNSEVQEKAMNLENYSFTTGQVIQILQNLLHNRASDIESSSVRDIISLINTLASQGALQSGDNFGSHFIHIHPKFNALCPICNREMDVFAGVDCICPHCKQVFKWSESQQRFFPQVGKL